MGQISPVEVAGGPPALLLFLPPSGNEASGIPLRYVVREDDYFVAAPAQRIPEWATRLRGSPWVRWQVDGRRFSGFATPAEPDSAEVSDVLSELSSRHGRDAVQRWFGPDAVVFRLHPQAAPELASAEAIERHFDAVAPEYDRLVSANPMDRGLRDDALRILLGLFRSGDRVLEIGCGTGLETLPLARAGVHVVGIDVSQGMLDRLRSKATAEGLEQRIELRKLRAADLGRLSREYGAGAFRGAFSDFGALNLEPDGAGVPAALADLVAPSGVVVLTVWNRLCLAEMGLYALGLRPRRALARLQDPVPVGWSRFGIPAHAYSPGPFLRPYAAHFRLERLEGLPVAVPPYDFLPHLPNPERTLPLLEAADRAIRDRFPFNRVGDHFLAVLRRR